MHVPQKRSLTTPKTRKHTWVFKNTRAHEPLKIRSWLRTGGDPREYKCIPQNDPKGYHSYMHTHKLQSSPGSHFAIVDSGTPIHIVFDHLFVCNTKEVRTPVAGFSGTASRATHSGDLNARVRTYHNEYITLIDVHSTLEVPDCVRRLFSVVRSVRQATHKGHTVLDSNKPGLWVCEQFIPFTNDPETNLWLLSQFPPTSKDNGIYPMPSYSAAAAYPALAMSADEILDDLLAFRQQWLMEHHRLAHPSQKRQNSPRHRRTDETQSTEARMPNMPSF
jgi:hypothetical protein